MGCLQLPLFVVKFKQNFTTKTTNRHHFCQRDDMKLKKAKTTNGLRP